MLQRYASPQAIKTVLSRSLPERLTVVIGCTVLCLSAEVYPTPARTLYPSMASQPTRPKTPKAALERLLSTQPISAEWFTPAFVTQVPVSQVQQIIDNLSAELGNYQSVTDGSDYQVVFERGFVPAQISTWLRAKQGKQYCVSATWNYDPTLNPTLEESRFMMLYAFLLGTLK